MNGGQQQQQQQQQPFVRTLKFTEGRVRKSSLSLSRPYSYAANVVVDGCCRSIRNSILSWKTPIKMLRRIPPTPATVPAILPRDDNVNNCDVSYSCRYSTNARGLDEYPEPFSIRDVRVGLGEIDRVFLAAAPRQPKQP
jgi:hypothetical protein